MTFTVLDTGPSPNHGDRPAGMPVDMLVLHYTGMESEAAAIARLCDPAAGVSSHYVVCEDGRILRLVAEGQRAWHAGVGSWRGHDDINDRSIGIEIVNGGHDYGLPDFPDAQVAAVIALSHDILRRNAIPARNVVAHSDTAPMRKMDPGEKFPWQALASAGIGHWVAPAPMAGGHFLSIGDQGEGVARLQALFADYGYGVAITGIYDEQTRAVVAAFQRHFRPSVVDGVADRSTLTTLAHLISVLDDAGTGA
ncbi:MAG: N-acetylmuramoyl-L-alanine amidase [Rhodobiaceae bacterium]|nr:N-acetylmuramoyl-L-alanine amidase [Rhodobiaceae bacterium]MCC0055665.1 N-acetylmuramoyl-L-alanine amidase [Rhodobiaceae bacterium]